jgi:hypothetical protein
LSPLIAAVVRRAMSARIRHLYVRFGKVHVRKIYETNDTPKLINQT